MRIGIGYDVHKFCKNRSLILGGVTIPYESGLAGHSDADVLAHAVMDAMLGATALGDIGTHFPDTDDTYKDANSMELLRITAELLRNNGYRVVNTDSTICAERPKLLHYIQEMRKNIASALSVDITCVSVKATTTEGLGFVGRGEGIGVMSITAIE